ncbi:MAG: hypothetical protein Q9180_007925 [Flavoplaca navasiana]
MRAFEGEKRKASVIPQASPVKDSVQLPPVLPGVAKASTRTIQGERTRTTRGEHLKRASRPPRAGTQITRSGLLEPAPGEGRRNSISNSPVLPGVAKISTPNHPERLPGASTWNPYLDYLYRARIPALTPGSSNAG